MAKAARAIIIESGRLLLMHRNKYGTKYFTLIGGRVNEDESTEDALVREVKEETGLNVTKFKLMFVEEHTSPYNEQYIYLCEVAPYDLISLQADSEEALMNKLELSTHEPVWVEQKKFSEIPFRTIQLQEAIIKGIAKGFPTEPARI